MVQQYIPTTQWDKVHSAFLLYLSHSNPPNHPVHTLQHTLHYRVMSITDWLWKYSFQSVRPHSALTNTQT